VIVDDPRYAPASGRNSRNRFGGEERRKLSSCNHEPVLNILLDFTVFEGLEATDHRHPLTQLLIFRSGKRIAQLRLTGQDYLN
jgi:hypothetical protein